jgi:hypothetical protein
LVQTELPTQPPFSVAHSSISAQFPTVPRYPGAHAQLPSLLQIAFRASSPPAPSQAL